MNKIREFTLNGYKYRLEYTTSWERWSAYINGRFLDWVFCPLEYTTSQLKKFIKRNIHPY